MPKTIQNQIPFGLKRSILLGTLLVFSSTSWAVNLCLDKATNKKVITEEACGEMATVKTTGPKKESDPTNLHPSQTQARRDRCKILIQRADSPTKARAFADLCTKRLDDVQFGECVNQVSYSNSPSKLAASVASCTGDIAASERIAPAPIIIQRRHE